MSAASDSAAKGVAVGRVLLTLALIPVGRRMFGSWDDPVGIPLLGDIDLAIHEFGHMLFMPFGIPLFGETGVIMGGSLTQIALPLIFTGYFAFSKKHRDLHAATPAARDRRPDPPRRAPAHARRTGALALQREPAARARCH